MDSLLALAAAGALLTVAAILGKVAPGRFGGVRVVHAPFVADHVDLATNWSNFR